MRIITAGAGYLDIDAYAGIIAYAELLNLQNINARAVSTAPLNESIPPSLRQWKVAFSNAYAASPDDTFTLIDTSSPQFIDGFVALERVDEVIDHHMGYEEYWQDLIGKKADIELVGAACTQVFERWEKAGKLSEISKESAGLLMSGILDNTLNFGADITTARDRHAYGELAKYAGLPNDWPARYFGEIQRTISADPVRAVKNDTKQVGEFVSRISPLTVGQLAVWDARQLLADYQDALVTSFDAESSEWFVNIISISEGKSYFICANPKLQGWVAELLGVTFDGERAVANRMWLRKEMVKRDITRADEK